MCRFCEYPFDKDNPVMLSGGYDYFGYGLDEDGNLGLIIYCELGYDAVIDDFFRVGPSYGLSSCMFCGRRFSDNENYYQERETDAARNYKEGVYEVKFSDGSKLLRKFLYKHLPGDNPGFESAAEIAAFVGDDSDGYEKFDGLSIVEEYAYDEDGHVWGAKWLPSYDYGRLAEIKHTPVFYFSDEVFFA